MNFKEQVAAVVAIILSILLILFIFGKFIVIILAYIFAGTALVLFLAFLSSVFRLS